MPPGILDQAIRQWAARSAFLPKASDLLSLGQKIARPAQPSGERGRELTAQELAERRNAAPDMRPDLVWCWNDQGGLWLEPRR